MRIFRYSVAGVVAAAAMLSSTIVSAAAQTTSPLTPARYTAFDMGYTFDIALDRKVTAARLADLSSFCETLDPVDRLLRSLHEECVADAGRFAASAAVDDCTSRSDCARKIGRLRPVLDKYARSLREANHVIDVEVPAGACRTAVRTSTAKLRAFTRLASAIGALVRAARSGSAKRLRRAQARVERAGRLGEELPSPAKERTTFRGACGPPPAVPPPAEPTPTLIR